MQTLTENGDGCPLLTKEQTTSHVLNLKWQLQTELTQLVGRL